jgi:hypothetical protein
MNYRPVRTSLLSLVVRCTRSPAAYCEVLDAIVASFVYLIKGFRPRQHVSTCGAVAARSTTGSWAQPKLPDKHELFMDHSRDYSDPTSCCGAMPWYHVNQQVRHPGQNPIVELCPSETSERQPDMVLIFNAQAKEHQ